MYQKENNQWREIDLDTHDYYQSGLLEYRPKFTFDNQVANSFNKHTAELNCHQDTLIKNFYNSEPDHHQLAITTLYEAKPLFLKAKQTLENFSVRDFNYLLTKNMDYKITFNSEPRDTINYYSKAKVYSKKAKKYEDLNYPSNINNYELFFPDKILSNTIYYSSHEAKKN